MSLEVLKTLRDIDGVEGSFVVTAEGQLLGRDLPAFFSDGVLGEAGTRVGRLCEALGTDQGPVDFLVVRYSEHQLVLKRLDSAFLAVVAGKEANMPALKMAANLVAKRVPKELQAPPDASAPSSYRSRLDSLSGAPAPVVVPAPVAAAPAAGPPVGAAEEPVADPQPPESPRRTVIPPEARGLSGSTSTKVRLFRGRRYEG